MPVCGKGVAAMIKTDHVLRCRGAGTGQGLFKQFHKLRPPTFTGTLWDRHLRHPFPGD